LIELRHVISATLTIGRLRTTHPDLRAVDWKSG
jgi:hypothetical protein